MYFWRFFSSIVNELFLGEEVDLGKNLYLLVFLHFRALAELVEEGDGGNLDGLHGVDDLAVVLGRLHVVALQVVGQTRVEVR